MENVVLAIHLILALLLIGVVLLQRSEGGGLGMGSGGGAISGRAAATALGKATWIIAIAFIATSIALTVLAARDISSGSVVDQLGATPAETAPLVPDAGGLGAVPGADLGAVPAPAETAPPASDAPATPPPAEN